MSDIISALIGAFVALLIWALSNKKVREKLQTRTVLLLGSLLILIVFSLVVYICILNLKMQGQENIIQTQKEGDGKEAINYLVDTLVEERRRYNSVQAEVVELSKEKDTLSVKIFTKGNELNELKKQLADFQKQRLQNSAKIDSLKLEIRKKEKEIESLKEKEARLTIELQTAQENLKKSGDSIKELENKLKSKEKEFNNVLEILKSAIMTIALTL